MARVRNWDVAVSQYIDTVIGNPFAYGETDCVTIAVRILESMCGDLDIPKLTYRTKFSALKAFSRHSIEKELRNLGAVQVSRLQRYDFCVVHETGGFPEGVSIAMANNTRLVSNKESGVRRIPENAATTPHVILRIPHV